MRMQERMDSLDVGTGGAALDIAGTDPRPRPATLAPRNCRRQRVGRRFIVTPKQGVFSRFTGGFLFKHIARAQNNRKAEAFRLALTAARGYKESNHGVRASRFAVWRRAAGVIPRREGDVQTGG